MLGGGNDLNETVLETMRHLVVDTVPGRSFFEKHVTGPYGRCKTRASTTKISRRRKRRIVAWKKMAWNRRKVRIGLSRRGDEDQAQRDEDEL